MLDDGVETLPTSQLSGKPPPKAKVAPNLKQAGGRRPVDDPPTPEEVEAGLSVLQWGAKKKISMLCKALLRHLCMLKGVQIKENFTIPELANHLESWVSPHALEFTSALIQALHFSALKLALPMLMVALLGFLKRTRKRPRVPKFLAVKLFQKSTLTWSGFNYRHGLPLHPVNQVLRRGVNLLLISGEHSVSSTWCSPSLACGVRSLRQARTDVCWITSCT